LEEYLEDCFALFFPAIHADIDWTRGVTFLDKELQQVVPEAELGRRIADKLVQVWLRSGADMWVLVHIEVQNQKDRDFARRMFIYFYRIYDRFERQVVSLAVLGDERATWRPAQYAMGLWGCNLRFTYPIVKLRDYQARREELESSQNPFATVVLAHLAAQETRRDMTRRQQVKLALTRRLYERGYSRARVLSLFRFIDWVLQLPAEQDRTFWQEIRTYEEERQMPYITSVERLGLEQGLERGLEQGLERGRNEGKREAVRRIVQVRFRTMPSTLEGRLAAADGTALDQMLDRVSEIQGVDDL